MDTQKVSSICLHPNACVRLFLLQMGGNPFGVPNMDAMAAFGFPGANMNPQVRGFDECHSPVNMCLPSDILISSTAALFPLQAADQLLKFMTDPK